MTEKENIIKMLGDIEFHDVPVKGLYIQTEKETKITIDYYLYIEEKKDYNSYSIVFSKIKSADLEQFPLQEETDMEISRFNYDLIDENFHCEILFLLGFGQPSFELKITCDHIEIINH